MDTGDLSTLGTKAPQGPKHFEDWSTPEITHSLQTLHPQHRQLSGQEGKTMLGDAPGMWASRTLAPMLSWPSIQDRPFPSPLPTKSRPSAAMMWLEGRVEGAYQCLV